MEIIALVLILYFLLGACVCLLVCVNPNDPGILGKMNRLVLGSMPKKIGDAIRRVCGDRVYNCFGNAKHYLLETNHPIVQIFYLIISPGGYVAYVTKGMMVFMPNRLVGYGMVAVGNILAFICFYVYYKACSVSPGKLSTDNKEYNVKKHREYYDNIMYTKGKECTTCKLTKPARSKHCRVCNMCVLKFDHHCIWIRQCVGQKNYKWFVLFLGLHSILCLYYSFIGFLSVFDFVMANRLFEMKFRLGNQLIDSNFLIVFQYIFMNHTTFIFLIFMCAIMGIALFLFVFYHFYLISQNLTTNERIKANDFIAQLKDQIKAKNKIVKAAGGEDKLPETIEHGNYKIPRARFVQNLRQDEKQLKYLQNDLINKGFIHNLKVIFNE